MPFSLYDIPAHLPFLDCLAQGVLRSVAEPERLSRVTILLPTRRSARALRLSFLRAVAPEGAAEDDGSPRALLLPRMRALAGLSTEDADELALPALLDLPPAVEPLRRRRRQVPSTTIPWTSRSTPWNTVRTVWGADRR